MYSGQETVSFSVAAVRAKLVSARCGSPFACLLAAATWIFNHHTRLLAAAPAEMNNLRNGYADWTALSPNKVASSRAGRAAAAEHNCTCKREAHVWVLLAAHERAHAAPQLHIFTHESCVYP